MSAFVCIWPYPPAPSVRTSFMDDPLAFDQPGILIPCDKIWQDMPSRRCEVSTIRPTQPRVCVVGVAVPLSWVCALTSAFWHCLLHFKRTEGCRYFGLDLQEWQNLHVISQQYTLFPGSVCLSVCDRRWVKFVTVHNNLSFAPKVRRILCFHPFLYILVQTVKNRYNVQG